MGLHRYITVSILEIDDTADASVNIMDGTKGCNNYIIKYERKNKK